MGRKNVKRIVRKSLPSLLWDSDETRTALLSEVVKTMKGICPPKHDSILRDCCEGNIIWHYILLKVFINLRN